MAAFSCERAVRRFPWSRVEEVEQRPLRQRMEFVLENADAIASGFLFAGALGLGAMCWGLLGLLGSAEWGGYEWAAPVLLALLCALTVWALPELAARRFAYPIMGVWVPMLAKLFLRSGPAAASADENGEAAEAAVGDAENDHSDEEAREFFRSVLRLQNVAASEIMTPRINMVSVREKETIKEALKTVVACGHSRLPVFRETRDQIVGVLYAKDLLKRLGEPDWSAVPVGSLMREPFFVPETKNCHDLLEEFQRRKVHLGVVVDEYGGTAGIVTIEDIIEELLGEIHDEHDRDQDISPRRVSETALEADAALRVDELNDILDVNLPEDEDFDTVGGYVSFVLGRVPSKGETFERDGVRFTVLESDQRRVKRLRVEIAASGS